MVRPSAHHAELARRKVSKLLEETASLEPSARLERLEGEVRTALAAQKLQMLESFSLIFGNGLTTDLISEHPVHDDGQIWDEVGFGHGHHHNHHMHLRRHTQHGLDHARAIGRHIAFENEFGIGAHDLRVAYIVGSGLAWRAVPTDPENENAQLTADINDALEAFAEQEELQEFEQEFVFRCDRDGEAFVRLFLNADGPLRVRFLPPESVRQPPHDEAPLAPLGIQHDLHDPKLILAYWVVDLGSTVPVPVSADFGIDGFPMPQILHTKLNADSSEVRGWPTMWPVRRNLARSEKLLRNMSYVSTLQAGIALIRKHEAATKNEVESFLDQARDLLVQK